MRTYQRLVNSEGLSSWVEVSTDANGFNDAVYIVTLTQCLQLNLGESPFYANYGIPAQPSVVQQVFPDYYVYQTQTQFSGYFASLIINKVATANPTYTINITTNQGAIYSVAMASAVYTLDVSTLGGGDVLG